MYMSHNTFGDVNTRPHHTEIYDPNPQFYHPYNTEDYSDPLTEAEAEGEIDVITHELTDDRGDIYHEPEDEADYEYEEGLRKLARDAVKSLQNEGTLNPADDTEKIA
jgi:hypothetical protein